MWIQGKGEQSVRMVNTEFVRQFRLADSHVCGVDTSGNNIRLMKYGEKSDGVAMITKIGRLIASGCQYLSLENPDDPVFNDHNYNDPQQ